MEIWQLDCSQASKDQVLQAVRASRKLLAKCGIGLRLRAYHSLKARPNWCLLPAGSPARLKVTEQFTASIREQHPDWLSLFLVPATQDNRLSWSEVPLGKKGLCDPSPLPSDVLDRYGSLFITDLAWSSITQHDHDPDLADRPWLSILLSHEIFHAATFLRHPTRQPDGNLMADGLSALGTQLSPQECECLKRSPYLQK